MLRVLVIGDNPFRIRDQILFCEQLLSINPSYKFTFFIVNKNLIPFFRNKSKKITYFLVGKEKKLKKNNNLDILKKTPFTLSELIIFFLVIFDLYKNYFRIKKVIDTLKPNIIISNKDSNIGIEPIILKIAKEKKINIVIPYLVYSDNIGIAELYSRRNNKKKSESFLTQLIMKMFPKQTITYKTNKFLFYSPSFTLAYKLFGTLSKNPWFIGHGLNDLICVDTQHTYKRYIDYKIPKKKLRIIGDIVFDKLFLNFNKAQIIKKTVSNKYQLNKNQKIIIISLPQLVEIKFMSQETQLKEIDFLLMTLQELNCNVLVSLHPRMNPIDYQFLEKKYACKIITERLFDVITIADLFISTYSSTIIWSVLSRVPSIIIDFNALNYSMYNFLKSVAVVKEKKQFRKTIKGIFWKKMNFNNDWNELSRDKIFDGHTINRYNELFIKSSSKYN